MADVQIEGSWKAVLAAEFEKEYFIRLKQNLLSEKAQRKQVFPAGSLIFNAFNRTPFDKVKVVILGQDPYHGPGQAHGLSFSVPVGVPAPPSLQNIFKEISSDIGGSPAPNGNLERWADQGVLLLNAILTVRANEAASHRNFGWEPFTNEVIRTLSAEREHLVFLLWGRFAQEKAALINQEKHLILKAAHPSPLSAYNGFFGCKHFSTANAYLQSQGLSPVSW